jgi:glutamate/tyrosine decarboxylase-like PLP-dependent enzyme
MAHMSIAKGAGMLGLGSASVRSIAVDDQSRMDPRALDAALADDRQAGRLPVCVVATAGDVNTGAIDPLDAIAEICARHGVWLHVDASYGGFAALVPSIQPQLAALGRADSIALDPHKWLFAPLDAGCLLVRDAAALHRTFSHGAAYIDVVADRDMSEFAFWDYGPELSRRFRALKIWFALKYHGTDAFAAAIARSIAVAQHLAARISASDDFELLAPAPLSIVCFRHVPPGSTRTNTELDAFNRQLMLDVQRGGDSYLSNASINGTFALRACIVNFRTTAADADGLLADLRRCAHLRV